MLRFKPVHMKDIILPAVILPFNRSPINDKDVYLAFHKLGALLEKMHLNQYGIDRRCQGIYPIHAE